FRFSAAGSHSLQLFPIFQRAIDLRRGSCHATASQILYRLSMQLSTSYYPVVPLARSGALLKLFDEPADPLYVTAVKERYCARKTGQLFPVGKEMVAASAIAANL
ncbi:MAG TPA: hypothetical protein VH280_11840, partial [Verrucomicrobiae bacterium]|nr:hypothetical protein [Verrucomicrobiae bacterium]